MDIQRTILLVALAVVSYMMVLQWNQDYGQAPVTAAITQSSSVNQHASTAQPQPRLMRKLQAMMICQSRLMSLRKTQL